MSVIKSIMMCLLVGTVYSAGDQTANNPQWKSASHDHCNTNSNPGKNKIGPNNVKDLKLDWVSLPDIPDSPVGPFRFPSLKNPIVDQGVVYYNNFAFSLQASKVSDGTLLWQFTPGEGAFFTESAIDGDFLYATGSFFPSKGAPFDMLFKLNKSDGSIVWKSRVGNKNTGNSMFAATSFIDGLVIVPTATTSEGDLNPDPKLIASLNAFDKETGEPVWQFIPEIGGGGTIESTPAYDTKLKLLYIGMSDATFPPANPDCDSLIAIDYRTGKKVWSYQFTKNDSVYADQTGTKISRGYQDLDVLSSPNLFNTKKDGTGRDVVGVNSKKGIYTTFDRATGEVIWQKKIRSGFPTLLGNPSAAFVNGTVYTILSWTKKPLLNVGFDYAYDRSSDPTLLNYWADIQINRCMTSIFALNASNGKVKWRKDFSGNVLGSITESNGVLYTGTADGRFLAFSAKNGDELFSFQFPPTYSLCFAPPPVCESMFPNLPPTNLPLISPILYGDITVAENKVFVPVGFTDLRIPFTSGITEGGLYVFSLNGKAPFPDPSSTEKLSKPCKGCKGKNY